MEFIDGIKISDVQEITRQKLNLKKVKLKLKINFKIFIINNFHSFRSMKI